MEPRRCGPAACSSGSTPAAAPPAGTTWPRPPPRLAVPRPRKAARRRRSKCAPRCRRRRSRRSLALPSTRRKPAAWRVSCSTASTTDLTQPCCRSTSKHKQVQTDSTSTGRRRRQLVTRRRSSRVLVMRHSLCPDHNGNAGSGWCGKFRQLWRCLWRDLHQDRRPDLCHRARGKQIAEDLHAKL